MIYRSDLVWRASKSKPITIFINTRYLEQRRSKAMDFSQLKQKAIRFIFGLALSLTINIRSFVLIFICFFLIFVFFSAGVFAQGFVSLAQGASSSSTSVSAYVCFMNIPSHLFWGFNVFWVWFGLRAIIEMTRLWLQCGRTAPLELEIRFFVVFWK